MNDSIPFARNDYHWIGLSKILRRGAPYTHHDAISNWFRIRRNYRTDDEFLLLELVQSAISSLQSPRRCVEDELRTTMCAVAGWCSEQYRNCAANTHPLRRPCPDEPNTMLMHRLWLSAALGDDRSTPPPRTISMTGAQWSGALSGNLLVTATAQDGNCFFDSIIQAVPGNVGPACSVYALRASLAAHILATSFMDRSSSPQQDHLTRVSEDYWTMQCLEDDPSYYETPHASHGVVTQPVAPKYLSEQGRTFRYLVIQFFLFVKQTLVRKVLCVFLRGMSAKTPMTFEEAIATTRDQLEQSLHNDRSFGRLFSDWQVFYDTTKPRLQRHGQQHLAGSVALQQQESEMGSALDHICRYYLEAAFSDEELTEATRGVSRMTYVGLWESQCTKMLPLLDLYFHSAHAALDCSLERLLLQSIVRIVHTLAPTVLVSYPSSDPICHKNGGTAVAEYVWTIPWTLSRAMMLAAFCCPATLSWYPEYSRHQHIRKSWRSLERDDAASTALAAFEDDTHRMMRMHVLATVANACLQSHTWADEQVLYMMRDLYPWMSVHVWSIYPMPSADGGSLSLGRIHCNTSNETDDASTQHVHILLQGQHYEPIAFWDSWLSSVHSTSCCCGMLQASRDSRAVLLASVDDRPDHWMATRLDMQQHRLFMKSTCAGLNPRTIYQIAESCGRPGCTASCILEDDASCSPATNTGSWCR